MAKESIVRTEAGAAQYTKEYYLTSCGGAADYHLLLANLDTPDYPLPIYDTACKLGHSPTLSQPRTLVDIGCGRGEMLALYAARGWTTIGVDFSLDALNLSDEVRHQLPASVATQVNLLCADAKNLCFADNSIDLVLMLDFVEHLQQPELKKVMTDVYRVLRPGGRVIVHTQPTINFIRYGQHFYRLLCKLRGRPVAPRLTFESEEKFAHHCNIHSRHSLSEAMQAFAVRQLYYSFTVNNTPVKKSLEKIGLVNYLTRNLWAIGYKEV